MLDKFVLTGNRLMTQWEQERKHKEMLKSVNRAFFFFYIKLCFKMDTKTSTVWQTKWKLRAIKFWGTATSIIMLQGDYPRSVHCNEILTSFNLDMNYGSKNNIFMPIKHVPKKIQWDSSFPILWDCYKSFRSWSNFIGCFIIFLIWK